MTPNIGTTEVLLLTVVVMIAVAVGGYFLAGRHGEGSTDRVLTSLFLAFLRLVLTVIAAL